MEYTAAAHRITCCLKKPASVVLKVLLIDPTEVLPISGGVLHADGGANSRYVLHVLEKGSNAPDDSNL